jgi:hypothetical protein
VGAVKKWGIAFVATMCAMALVASACGGGGDDEDNDGTRTSTRTARTGTAVSTRTGTPDASTTAGVDASPGASGTAGTNAQGTPVPGATAAPGATAPAASANATPGAVPTVNAAEPFLGVFPTAVAGEQEYADPANEIDPGLIGGDPSTPPRVVTDLPPRPPGATIDPYDIAPPNASASGIEFIIDTNASEPGIQGTRTVKVGDVFRVGVVVTNIPAPSGGQGGLTAFGFEMLYDIRRIIAPTIEGGSSLGRNPDMNEAGLGGAAPEWSCLPPGPEGDADEPGGYIGDGDPATGQAIIGCYTPGRLPQSGTLVLATVQFQAISPGTLTLRLSGNERTGVFDVSFQTLADCGLFAPVPCRTASINVTN